LVQGTGKHLLVPAELWTLESDGNWRTEYGSAYSVRDNLVYGTYRPDASTTGITSDVGDLTVYAGNLYTTSANQVIENMWVQGKIVVHHENVTVRNCLIDGATAGPSSPSYASITCYDNFATSSNFYDCTITGSITTVYSSNGVQGRDMNLYRCDISGTVDGIGAQYENVGIYGCWIHDLPWYSWDPGHSDGSHNDGIQVHGGSNFTIRGNSIEVGYKGTSGIIVTQDVGATSNVTIDQNWIMSVYPTTASATSTGINVSQTGASTAAMTGVVITDNIFSALSTWRVNHAGLIDRGTYDIATITGNVYDGTATAAKITRV
jgi:hypothetical protein